MIIIEINESEVKERKDEKIDIGIIMANHEFFGNDYNSLLGGTSSMGL